MSSAPFDWWSDLTAQVWLGSHKCGHPCWLRRQPLNLRIAFINNAVDAFKADGHRLKAWFFWGGFLEQWCSSFPKYHHCPQNQRAEDQQLQGSFVRLRGWSVWLSLCQAKSLRQYFSEMGGDSTRTPSGQNGGENKQPATMAEQRNTQKYVAMATWRNNKHDVYFCSKLPVLLCLLPVSLTHESLFLSSQRPSLEVLRSQIILLTVYLESIKMHLVCLSDWSTPGKIKLLGVCE